MNLVLDSTRITHDFHMSMMLGAGYHRLNPQLPRNIPLDAVDDIPELGSLASNVDLSETEAFIQVQLYTRTCCLICDARSGALVQRRNFQGCGGFHC